MCSAGPSVGENMPVGIAIENFGANIEEGGSHPDVGNPEFRSNLGEFVCNVVMNYWVCLHHR